MAKKKKVKKNKWRAHLIDHFRESVEERYTFNFLEEHLDIDEFDEDMMAEVRYFFLERIYPTEEKRNAIESSMENMGKYLKNPSKLKLLVGSMTTAIFKFGTQLPAAIKAAYTSFESFNTAIRLEKKLEAIAKEKELEIPIDREVFNELIEELPPKQLKTLVKNVEDLFNAVTNIKLIKKTIDILGTLKEKMQEYPDEFPESDIDALEFGTGILIDGQKIFEKYDKDQRKLLVNLIKENETNFIQGEYFNVS